MSPKEKNIGSMYGSRETSTFLGLPACSDLAALDARIAIHRCRLRDAICERRHAYCAGAPVAIRAAMANYSGDGVTL